MGVLRSSWPEVVGVLLGAAATAGLLAWIGRWLR